MSDTRTIPLPAYLLEDAELIDVAKRLEGFAKGDPDVADQPCERAAEAIRAITRELQKRGGTYRLEGNTIINTAATAH